MPAPLPHSTPRPARVPARGLWRAAALVAVGLLVACGDAPADLPPHDPEADRLLAFVTGDAWDGVFAGDGGARYRVETASGDTTAAVGNPLPAFLSDEPPYLDAAAREQYETRLAGDTTVAGVAATLVEAEFVADGRRTQPVRYVRAAVDSASGALLAVEIRREVASTLYDESSRLRADLARGPGGRPALVPGSADIRTTTDVPLSDARTERLAWRLVP